MKKSLMALSTALIIGATASAQKVEFEEFDLDNGLHVVLFDEATESTQLDVESKWFNYRGYSELITLVP